MREDVGMYVSMDLQKWQHHRLLSFENSLNPIPCSSSHPACWQKWNKIAVSFPTTTTAANQIKLFPADHQLWRFWRKPTYFMSCCVEPRKILLWAFKARNINEDSWCNSSDCRFPAAPKGLTELQFWTNPPIIIIKKSPTLSTCFLFLMALEFNCPKSGEFIFWIDSQVITLMMSKRSVLLATQNPKKAQDLNSIEGVRSGFIHSLRKEKLWLENSSRPIIDCRRKKERKKERIADWWFVHILKNPCSTKKQNV